MWVHGVVREVEHESTACPYCPKSVLKKYELDRSEIGYIQGWALDQDGEERRTPVKAVKVHACGKCGWWTACLISADDHSHRAWTGGLVAHAEATLAEFSTAPVPMSELRRYVATKGEALFDLHPRRFEELVASVYSDHGFDTHVTAYSQDGGIDIVLTDQAEQQTAVQVKRYRSRVAVNEIRELLGVMVLNRLTRGIIVTTSDFTRGAIGASRQLRALKSHSVELVNGARFLKQLRMVQRSSFELLDVAEAIRDVDFEHWTAP